MNFTLNDTLIILATTPPTIKQLLQHLPVEWIVANEGENTFSPFDVVGHLIQGEESDWMQRATIILNEGLSRPFDKFDRFAQFIRFKGKSLDELVTMFETARNKNLATLQSWNLTETQLGLQGLHPALGVVTLKQLLATWVAHDLDHIGQIVRVMAKQYSEEVGPWKEYLSILKDRQK